MRETNNADHIDTASSILSTTGDAFVIPTTNIGDALIVDSSGYLISTVSRGIDLAGAAQTYDVTVNGVVSGLGVGFDGILMGFGDSNATIKVGQVGRVAGNRAGVWLEGGGTIINAGLIAGTTDAGIVQTGIEALTIDNQGSIVSENQAAIQVTGDGVHTINNSGTLKGLLGGIRSFNSGVENVTNSGTILGNIELGGGDDIVNNTGTITGTVSLGAGSDNYDGSSGVDIVDGGDDGDGLSGGGGDDQLTGGAGGDVINGGTGNDTLTGGLDNDDYVVDSQGDTIVEGAGGGTDDRVFASVSYVLAPAAYIEVLVTTDPSGTAAINLTGNALLGQIMQGNAGNNVLNGGVDGFVDALQGFGGNDTYVLGASTNDTVTDTAGIDKIESSITRSLVVSPLITGDIENLTLTGALAINGTGNALANTITGNGAANILDGGIDALADTLTGGLGNDTYMIRTATDNITEAVGGGTADRAKAAVSFTLAAGDNIEFLETVLASAGTAINLTGNEIAQTVIGNAGSNILNGKGGNDTLTGGLGNDFFLFNTALNATTNRDTITDFNVAADTIRLENTGAGLFNTLAVGTLNAAFFKANATGTATDADDRIIYETDTGKLFYDSNGNAAGGSVHFATLSNAVKPVLTNLDFFII